MALAHFVGPAMFLLLRSEPKMRRFPLASANREKVDSSNDTIGSQ
jgi:hypothetical protein